MNVEDQQRLEAMTKSIFHKLNDNGIQTLTYYRTTKDGEIIPDYWILDDKDSLILLATIPESWSEKDSLHQDLLIFAYQIYNKALKNNKIDNKLAYTERILKNKALLTIDYNIKSLQACTGYAHENYEINDTDFESRCFLEAKTVPNLEYKPSNRKVIKPDIKDSNRKKRNASWNPYFYDVLKRYRLPGMTQEKLALHFDVSRKTMNEYMRDNFITKRQLTPEEYLEIYAGMYGKNDFYKSCMANLYLFSIKNASQRVFCNYGQLIVLEDDEE